MSLKEAAQRLAANKFGKMPTDAGEFLHDLVEPTQKPAQTVKPPAAIAQPVSPKPASERVARSKTKAEERGDIRRLNTTERGIQFSTRIDPDLDLWIFEICARRKAKLRRNQRYGLADFLEDAARALDKEDGVSRETT